jgi:hypothetical protein
VLETLERWGALLWRPRAAIAATPRDRGAFDGLWLGLAYVFGSQMIEVGQALKALSITMDATGAMTLLGAMGRMALPPILLSLVVELLLGKERAYRRGVYLLPLVVTVTAANLSRQLGWSPWFEFAPVFVGATWSLLLVLATRARVEPWGQEEGDAA